MFFIAFVLATIGLGKRTSATARAVGSKGSRAVASAPKRLCFDP